MKWLVAHRVPKGKIVIGSAFYSRIFEVKDTKANGLYRPGTFKRTVPWSAIDTTITPEKGWDWFRDPQAKVPYAFNPASREFLTGDDIESVKAKSAYVRQQGLGGIMFWQLKDDTLKGGLLDAMHKALRLP